MCPNWCISYNCRSYLEQLFTHFSQFTLLKFKCNFFSGVTIYIVEMSSDTKKFPEIFTPSV